MKTNPFKVLSVTFCVMFAALVATSITPAKAKKTAIVENAGLIAEATKNIEFDFAKAGVRNDYYQNLNLLVKLMSEKSYALSLRGHADAIGSYVPNWKLSDKRAIQVKEYLVSKGVKAERIVTTPYGSTVPIASNKTEEGRQKNRRVEIKLQEIE